MLRLVPFREVIWIISEPSQLEEDAFVELTVLIRIAVADYLLGLFFFRFIFLALASFRFHLPIFLFLRLALLLNFDVFVRDCVLVEVRDGAALPLVRLHLGQELSNALLADDVCQVELRLEAIDGDVNFGAVV